MTSPSRQPSRVRGLLARARSTAAALRRAAGPVLAGAGRAAATSRQRLRPVTERIAEPGWAVLGLGVVAWVIGWQFGWEELMTLAAACLLMVVAATLFTLGRSSLEVSLGLEPPRVTVGEPAIARVHAHNTGARQILGMVLEVPVGKDGLARLSPPTLGHGQDFAEPFVIPTHRRAVIRVGPVRSVRGDPLGLARREVVWCDPMDLIVHPKVVLLPGAAAGWMRDLEGMTTNDLSPADVAFHTLREYVPGDDRRSIHWRSSARTGKLMVRQFVDTRRAHLGIVLSTRAEDYGSEDEFELAVSVTASLGASALQMGQQVTSISGGATLPARDRIQLLDGLAAVELEVDGEGIDVVTRRSKRALDTASVAILVAGSRSSVTDLRSASSWLPSHLRALVVRIDPDAEPSVRAVRDLQLLTIREPRDLVPRLRALAVR
jgi:uncharacterized protein (DUF58 family)